MNILVTGAKGFVGRNLVSQLHNIQSGKAKNYGVFSDMQVFEYDVDSDPCELDVYCKRADFVFNLAGVNLPRIKLNSCKAISVLLPLYLIP